MKFKSVLWVVLAFGLFWAAIPLTAGAATASYTLTVDDKKLNSPLAPQFKNGATFVPMRAIFEALGAKVSYDSQTKRVSGQRGNRSVALTVGSTKAYLDKSAITLQQAPMTVGSNVYVPLRFVSEALGAEVEVDASAKTINIRTAEMELTVTEKLPVSMTIQLKHAGNVKLKWWFQDESPYQHYQGFVGPDGKLIFKSFDEFITTDKEGKVLSRETYEDAEETSFDVKLDSATGKYNIAAERDGKSYSWSQIPLFDMSFSYPLRLYGGEAVDSYRILNGVIDKQGNLITLTEKGVSAFNAKGEQLWNYPFEMPSDDPLLSFIYYPEVQVDSANHVFIQTFGSYAVLDPQGRVILSGEGYSSPSIMSDDTLLMEGSSYRLVDDKLKLLASPYYNDGSAGTYASSDKENSVARLDPTTGQTLWTYKQAAEEKQRGYSLSAYTLVVDGQGNSFISTNGGTIHALDPEGQMRFKLTIDHDTSTQILPLTPTTFVAVAGNLVMCFEIENK
ncbi:copper amine oxidase N-terminal domain-containing protein [Cohnella sp. AR92]|uniref:copper amine oxidase N-terminal domain-containing protein n=1 Tax=Cohnella sp. AR92 TaxID=648716 RepID=UPI000F8D43B6|nr:stalk domain-containing protein [Cohnella sp. AR92]RUS45574.1 hypothetical protein ELR57_19705 [Cohnella sp. AR92]